MIQRYWRFLLAALVILVVAVGFWLWNRPPAQPTLEHITLDDGSALIRVVPSTKVRALLALALPIIVSQVATTAMGFVDAVNQRSLAVGLIG